MANMFHASEAASLGLHAAALLARSPERLVPVKELARVLEASREGRDRFLLPARRGAAAEQQIQGHAQLRPPGQESRPDELDRGPWRVVQATVRHHQASLARVAGRDHAVFDPERPRKRGDAA